MTRHVHIHLPAFDRAERRFRHRDELPNGWKEEGSAGKFRVGQKVVVLTTGRSFVITAVHPKTKSVRGQSGVAYGQNDIVAEE